MSVSKSNMARVKLINVDMSGSSFEDVNFEGVDFSNVNLDGVIFRKCNLKNAIINPNKSSDISFFESDLTNASIAFERIRKINLSGNSYEGSFFKGENYNIPEWIKASIDKNGFFSYKNLSLSARKGFKNFNNANIEDVDFNGIDLSEANFSNAKISESSFKKSNLTNAIFTGAEIRSTDFSYADLTNADLNVAYIEYEGNLLNFAKIENSKINSDFLLSSSIDGVKLSGISDLPTEISSSLNKEGFLDKEKYLDFIVRKEDASARSIYPIFYNMIISDIVFYDKNFSDGVFDNVSLKNVKFINCSFNMVKFKDTTFEKVDFKRNKFNDSDFSNVKFVSSSFDDALFQGGSWYQVSFNSSSMMNSSLKQIEFDSLDTYNSIFNRVGFVRSNFHEFLLNNSSVINSELYKNTLYYLRVVNSSIINPEGKGSFDSIVSEFDMIDSNLESEVLTSFHICKSSINSKMINDGNSCFESYSQYGKN